MPDKFTKDEIRSLKRNILINRILLIILTGVLILISVLQVKLCMRQSSNRDVSIKDGAKTAISKPSPHYAQVMGIIQPLKYSGFYALIRPEVTLEIDFQKNKWHLRHLHRFDSEGRLILDRDNSGLCGELAAYTSEKLRGVFGQEYTIRFADVAESGFFLSPRSTHRVLLIHKDPSQVAYLVDPSLHRYGDIDDFDDYLFFGTSNSLEFVDNKDPDAFFDIDHGTPILISRDYLVTLTVEKSSDKFDKDNFVIALSASRRYKYTGRYLFAVRRSFGMVELFENKPLVEQILDINEYNILRKRILDWFDKI